MNCFRFLELPKVVMIWIYESTVLNSSLCNSYTEILSLYWTWFELWLKLGLCKLCWYRFLAKLVHQCWTLELLMWDYHDALEFDTVLACRFSLHSLVKHPLKIGGQGRMIWSMVRSCEGLNSIIIFEEMKWWSMARAQGISFLSALGLDI